LEEHYYLATGRLILTDSFNRFCHIGKNLIRISVFVVLLYSSYRRKVAIYRTSRVMHPLSSRLWTQRSRIDPRISES